MIPSGSSLRADFLHPGVLPLPRRLGMTSCPGRRAPLRDDLAELRHLGVHLLVSLVDDYELVRFGVADLVEAAAEIGLEVVRLPIIDGCVPDLHALMPVVGRVLVELGRGRTVVVHCAAGYGRTGTVVACCLVARGFSAERAIEEVRRARPGTIENGGQEAFIGAFATR